MLRRAERRRRSKSMRGASGARREAVLPSFAIPFGVLLSVGARCVAPCMFVKTDGTGRGWDMVPSAERSLSYA